MKVYSLMLGSYQTNCYLAADDDGVCAVIDPGYTPERVLEAAQQVVLGPLALMGFCYLDFSTRLGRPGSKAKRIIIYVLIVLVPYRTNILALVGLMDKMLKTRTRFVPNDKAK